MRRHGRIRGGKWAHDDGSGECKTSFRHRGVSAAQEGKMASVPLECLLEVPSCDLDCDLRASGCTENVLMGLDGKRY